MFHPMLIGMSLLQANALHDAPPNSVQDSISANLSIRSFGGHTEGNYASLALRWTGPKDLSIYLKGDTGKNNTTPVGSQTLSYGGRNLELGLSVPTGYEHLSASAGIDFPTVPAQNTPSATYGLTYAGNEGWRADLLGYTGSRAALGVRLTKDTPISSGLNLKASLTGLLSGNTSVSTNSGNDIRELIYNVALEVPVSSLKFRVGVTNSLGETTRFSLNSSVGHRVGLLLGVGGSF